MFALARSRRNAACALACVMVFVGVARRALDARRPSGGGGERGRNIERAFVLRVDLKFMNVDDANALIAAWGEAADWCRANEEFLWHYEISRSDQDETGTTFSIYERYRSKEDYLRSHKESAAFKTFRPKMQALQDAGRLVVSGSSFIELGVGFVS